jgi:hypothetical protein
MHFMQRTHSYDYRLQNACISRPEEYTDWTAPFGAENKISGEVGKTGRDWSSFFDRGTVS